MKKLVFLVLLFSLGQIHPVNQRITHVGIQPFANFDKSLIDTVKRAIIEVYNFNVAILPVKSMPQKAFVNAKSPRYRADTLIRMLKHTKTSSVDYVIGLTGKDISTTKRDKLGKIKKPEYKYTDWGVFGLGYCPGPSCIVSTFRLQKCSKAIFINRLKKIAVHELGHNLGLKHCNSDKCVMHDANETIKTIDYVDLKICNACKLKIREKH